MSIAQNTIIEIYPFENCNLQYDQYDKSNAYGNPTRSHLLLESLLFLPF